MSRNHALLVLAAITAAPLFVSCGGGGSHANTPVSVSVAPASINVPVGKMQQFNATVSGTTNTAVTWAVAGGAPNGTISAAGLYTAPPNVPSPAMVTVTATSMADSSKTGSATVTVTNSAVSVSVSPLQVNVATFGTQQFSANVTGTANTAVTWQVNGTAGGSQQFGFISAAGLYVAPGGVPTASDGSSGNKTTTLTVTAVSQASGTMGNATVTLIPAGQNAQAAPIKLGGSGSNAKDSSASGRTITCCGGTLGSLLSIGGTQFILSNNHVLARSDQSPQPVSPALGEAIVNPGLIDNNCAPATTVANLSKYYNLETGTGTKVDAAIAKIVPGQVDTGGNILYLGSGADGNGVPMPGAPESVTAITASPAKVGESVAKSGRTTGLTCSTVMAVNVSVTNVQYQRGCGTGTTFDESFQGQVSIAGGSFSAGGDSGSLIVDQGTATPLALLFAGSDQDTVGNPIADVLNFFSTPGNTATIVGGGPHQVIGCTLPVKPQSATTTLTAQASAESLQQATAVRDAHASELLAHPEVQAVGVGASYDNPNQPALVFFVTQGQPRTGIPTTVDGVRTRIIEAPLFANRGALTPEQTRAMEQTVAPPQPTYPILGSEMARAKTAHTAHVSEWMSKAGVQGFGIGSSVDAPGEAAIVIFLIRGVAHDPIPATLDGVRTRIREGSRFRAGYGDSAAPSTCKVPKASTKSH